VCLVMLEGSRAGGRWQREMDGRGNGRQGTWRLAGRGLLAVGGAGGDGPAGGDLVVLDDQEFGDQVDGGAGVVGDDRDGLAKGRAGVVVQGDRRGAPRGRRCGPAASPPGGRGRWSRRGRSGLRTLEPALSTSRPGAGRLTTVAATIRATSSMVAAPNSICMASLKT
jgi:hypothetical protein